MFRHRRLILLCALVAGLALVKLPVFGQESTGVPVAEQFNALHFRSIGPASMSGRITDFAVYEPNPAIFYVASAHGGVWKTTNNGATFIPEFQDNGLMSIGDLAVSQRDPNLLWVGTGEGNNRQSISWGDGIFKSTDGGKTFTKMGLDQSYHINRIVMDPNDSNIVLAAAQGNLFAPGGDRGVYKTADGGKTWKQTLKVDADTGANDLVMDPNDTKILYASTYSRRRSQCCFNGGGPGSGVWKSTDGGDTWTRLTAGLPTTPMGRIGLDLYRKNPRIVYALVQAEENVGGRATTEGGSGALGGLYRSDDAGANWKRVNSENARPMYFSQVRVDPNNENIVYEGGVGLHMSIDGGNSVENDAAQAIHDDVHAIWIDPSNSDHLMIGDDGGVAISYDKSKTWEFLPNLPVGLFYHVDYDMSYPYNVCGGMQDNYDWCGPSAARTRGGIANDKWITIQGGDGFVAIIDKRDPHIVYSETQDGSIQRHNISTGEAKSIRPSPQNTTDANPGGAYRFNWDTPMVFAPNDSGVLYVGGNKLFKSTDRGDSWVPLSPDLTTNADRSQMMIMGLKAGDVKIQAYDGIKDWPTLVSVAESPKQPGLFFTGSDDGTVSMSKDGGKTWDKNVADRLPGFVKGAWVSKVAPSRYDANTVYITSDAHRIGDYGTFVWASNDMGATFHSISNNLKGEAIKTLTEDQKNPDVLYLGAETGLFVSIDRGKSWQRIKANLPDVRVDEITLHSRDNAMILATHGRSIWILDHIEPIQEYAAAQSAANGARLFTPGPALEWKSANDRNMEFWGHNYFMGENPPFDAVIQYYLKDTAKDVKLKITDAAGKDVRELTAPANRLGPGIQTTCWDLRTDGIGGQNPAAAFGNRGGGGGAAGGGGRPGGAGAAGGGAAVGRAGSNSNAVPGTPSAQPQPGYESTNVCGGGAAGGRGGGGGFGGGGGGGIPVAPGIYNVALIVDGKTIETKPIKVVLDPTVQFSDAQRKAYFDLLQSLHDLQRRGTQMTETLTPLDTQMSDAATKIKDDSKVPASVKTQFDALNKDFDDLKAKFGVGAGGGGRGGRGGGGGGGGGRGAGGGGRGAGAAGADAAGAGAVGAPANGAGANAQAGGGPGGFGGGPVDNANLVGRAGTVKTQIMTFTETPSDTLMKEANDVKAALPKAISDANAFLLKAMTMSQTLKKYDITLNVPAPVK